MHPFVDQAVVGIPDAAGGKRRAIACEMALQGGRGGLVGADVQDEPAHAGAFA
jgi:hypothetical protein